MMHYNYYFKNKGFGCLLFILLVCNLAQAESSLNKCQGTSFPTWDNCYGKAGPLPVSGDIYDGEWKKGK